MLIASLLSATLYTSVAAIVAVIMWTEGKAPRGNCSLPYDERISDDALAVWRVVRASLWLPLLLGHATGGLFTLARVVFQALARFFTSSIGEYGRWRRRGRLPEARVNRSR